MKKTHKFLVCLGDSDWIADEIDPQYHPQIEWCDDPNIEVIECHHENFMDNLVEIPMDGYGPEYFHELLKDVNGKLYVWTDYKTRAQLINEME